MHGRITHGLLALHFFIGVGCGSDDDPMGEDGEPRILEADVCLVDGCTCGALENEDSIGPVPPDELGHWAAGHIGLPAKPYDVGGVVFGVSGPRSPMSTSLCRPNVPMRVRIFVSDSATPPIEPEVLWEGSPSVEDTMGLHFVELPVQPPLRIDEGQELFVSMEMAGTPEAFVCLYSCNPAPTTASQASWWSNAAEPPYSWASLSDFGITGAYHVGITGSVVE